MGLALKYRMFFYGIHGFFDEVVFTSIHDFILVERDARLKGHSSLYAFFLYGLASFHLEYMYFRLLKGKHFALRSLVYLAYGFSWEFAMGLLLSQMSACPWDYSHKPLNFLGLITLDYGPLWIGLAFYQEVLSEFLRSINIGNCTKCSTKNAND